MANNYPASYRSSSARAGYQAQVSDFTRQRKVPANDNFRVPNPANDNIPRSVPTRAEQLRAMRKLGLDLFKRYSWVGDDLFELKNLAPAVYSVFDNQPYMQSGGWELRVGPCSPSPFLQTVLPQWNANSAFTFCSTNQSGSTLIPLQDFRDGTNVAPVGIKRGFTLWGYQSCSSNPALSVPDGCFACHANAQNPRYAILSHWRRTLPTNAPNIPAPHAAFNAYFRPEENPNINPEVIKPLQWMPLHKPAPFPLTAVVRKAKEKYYEEYTPLPVPPKVLPVPRVSPPGTRPIAGTQPWVQPIFPSPVASVPPSGKRPPRKGEKQRKFISSVPSGSPLGRMLNVVTESADFTNALYFALPYSAREGWRKPPMHVKAQLIFRHFDEIDVNKAFMNLLTNEVGDRIGGYVGKRSAKANRNIWEQTGVSINLQSGPAL